MVWETNLADQPDVQLTAAPLVVKDKIINGRRRRRPRRARLDRRVDAKTGKLLWQKYVIPKPASPAARPGRTRIRSLADRRRRHVGDRQLRRLPATT